MPGLSTTEAQQRLAQHGPNALSEQPPKSLWQRSLRQFQSPLIYILLCALAVDLVIWVGAGAPGLPLESLAIALILLLNAGLGVYQESKAETALARLKALTAAQVWGLRDGRLVQLSSTALVPGDVIRLEAGDRIPADGAWREGQGLLVDEAVLTGESAPVDKAVASETFSGTLLVRGKGYLEITRTGAASTMGKLAALLGQLETEKTPLEKRLELFGNQIARAILALSVLIVIGGLLVEGWARAGHVLFFAVALAVAAVPEGLPAVLTLTLALGVERMAKRQAVVRRLSAVEALGSVTVIATDKTGTLTENRMTVKHLDTPDTARALHALVLANDAETETGAGDPLELALFEFARTHQLEAAQLHARHVRHSSVPFDSAAKFMRATVKEAGQLTSYVKGAPEVLLQRSVLTEAQRLNWVEKADAYAHEGFRVIALAWRAGEGEDELSFLGLVLLWDPPRAEVPPAIRHAQDAGVRVVMITGDHPATALAIANEVGIPPGRVLTGWELETFSDEVLRAAVKETNVFARVAPEHKLRLVEALKANGEIVAMTGDGVNDAPALKRADVGVAMGQRGSDVSREVADLVLLDDNFATIVAAIEEGRSIYENIQTFIRFLSAANLALVLLVIGGALGSFVRGLQEAGGGLLLPLTAIQLLWLNVITNGPPAIALGLDRNHGVMARGPRDPRAPLLDRASLRFVVLAGAAQAIIGGLLLLRLPHYGYDDVAVRSALFLYACSAQLLFAYPARRVKVEPLPNAALHFAVLLGAGLQALVVLWPTLRRVLGLTLPNVEMLGWIALTVALGWFVAELTSRVLRLA
ncbi:MAG: cation-transporting P-type ATPase [Acidobacteria bacterium]|nr:cation-transporting P-type ATPase [Acidobacteriota bacterium]MBI3423266.1 cation-transporting P-type ATPase [Acidobacteriota bacterium]